MSFSSLPTHYLKFREEKMGLEGRFKWCYARNVRERRIACSRVFAGYVGFGHSQSPSWKKWTDLSWFCFLDMLDSAVLWPHHEDQAFLESAKGINDAFSWCHMYKGHNNKHQNYPQLLSPCISEILSGFCPPVTCCWCLVFLFVGWLDGGRRGGGEEFWSASRELLKTVRWQRSISATNSSSSSETGFDTW